MFHSFWGWTAQSLSLALVPLAMLPLALVPVQRPHELEWLPDLQWFHCFNGFQTFSGFHLVSLSRH
jgi:hypothetical protein